MRRTMQSVVVGTGIPFAEGRCPDGTVVATSVAAGALYRVWPEQQKTKLPGVFGSLPDSVPATPGLQLARADGAVTYLADQDLHGPNDLAVTPDGDVFFTDPGHYPPSADDVGRVLIYGRDGQVQTFASGFFYCNGIAFDRDGNVVVVERRGLQRVYDDDHREWVIETLGRGGGDGFCLDADGRFYVASTIEHGVRVVDADGSVVDFLEIDGKGLTTNCCFGGDDLRTLFVTDAIPGNLVAFEHMPTPGLPLPTWIPPEAVR